MTKTVESKLKSLPSKLIHGPKRITLIILTRLVTEKDSSGTVLITTRPDVALPLRKDLCIGHINTSSALTVLRYTKR
jgi:hypothetical protein